MLDLLNFFLKKCPFFIETPTFAPKLKIKGKYISLVSMLLLLLQSSTMASINDFRLIPNFDSILCDVAADNTPSASSLESLEWEDSIFGAICSCETKISKRSCGDIQVKNQTNFRLKSAGLEFTNGKFAFSNAIAFRCNTVMRV